MGQIPIERPAMLRFRFRALAGFSVRAEVLTILLAANRQALRIDELVTPDTSRRSVERVVAELTQAGISIAHGKQRGRRFSLRAESSLAALMNPNGVETCTSVNWYLVLQLLAQLTALQNTPMTPGLMRVTAVNLGRKLTRYMRELHEDEPPSLIGREDAFQELLRWGTSKAAEWASGKMPLHHS